MAGMKCLLMLVIAIIASALATESDDYNLVSVRQCSCTIKKFPRHVAKQLEEQALKNVETIVFKDPEVEAVSYKPPPRQKRSPACRAVNIRSRSGRMVSVRRC